MGEGPFWTIRVLKPPSMTEGTTLANNALIGCGYRFDDTFLQGTDGKSRNLWFW